MTKKKLAIQSTDEGIHTITKSVIQTKMVLIFVTLIYIKNICFNKWGVT